MASANAQGVPPSSSSSPSAQPSKTFSLSLGSSKQKPSPLSRKPLTPSNGAKRPHSSLEDSDDEDDSAPKAQLVSSFDHAAGGAISVNGRQPEKAPLVIQTQKNRDWREESRRKKSRNLLPAEVQAAQASRGLTTGEDPDDRLNGAPQAYGLTFVQTESRENGQESQSEDRESKEPEIQKTEDQLALEALMSDGGQRSTNLVLPAVEDQDGGNGWNGRGNGVGEEDSFKSDVASRPEPASLEDYAAVPVEEFGAALLRGMGWKEGDVVGKRKDVISKPRVVERRPALLGIGAKEVPGGVGDEFGAWGKAAKGRRKVDKTYNPVLLRNSKTGEMLTEDELKVKKEEQKREEEDWKSRRDRNLAIDRDRKVERSRAGSRDRDRDRSNRRDRGSDKGSDSSRHSSRRRDRSRSPDSKRRRHRDDDEDYDRKERDRRRYRDDDDYDDRRAQERRRRDTDDDRHGSGSARRSHKEPKSYDDSGRKRRQEVY